MSIKERFTCCSLLIGVKSHLFKTKYNEMSDRKKDGQKKNWLACRWAWLVTINYAKYNETIEERRVEMVKAEAQLCTTIRIQRENDGRKIVRAKMENTRQQIKYYD